MPGEKIERVAEILDLFETDDPAELAFALAAAARRGAAGRPMEC
jgi:hypothetical protein